MRNMQTIFKPESSQDVAYTATPATFTVPADVYVLRLVPTTDCVLTYPDGPTVKLLFGVVEYLQCDPSDEMSVVRDAQDGSLNIGFMTN